MIYLTTTLYDKKYWTSGSYSFLVQMNDDLEPIHFSVIPTPANLGSKLKPGLRGIDTIPWLENALAIGSWNKILIFDVKSARVIQSISHPNFHDIHGLICSNDGFWITCAGKGLLQVSPKGRIINEIKVDVELFDDGDENRSKGKNIIGKYPSSFSFVFNDEKGDIYLSVQKKDHEINKNGGIYKYNINSHKLEPIYIGTSWIHDGLWVGSNCYFHDSMDGLVSFNMKTNKTLKRNYLGEKYFSRGLIYNEMKKEIISFGTEKESMKNKYGFQRITGKFKPKAAIMDLEMNIKRIIDLSWIADNFKDVSDIRIFSGVHMNHNINHLKLKSTKDRVYETYYNYFYKIYMFKDRLKKFMLKT